jgi:hypothetical protein
MCPTKFQFIRLRRLKGDDANVKSKQMTDDGRRAPSDGKSSQFLFDNFLKSSPLKRFSQMNRYLVRSNYVWSSIEIAHCIPIPQTEHKYDLSRMS